MGGYYPNGGYRNVTATELSMPSQATPPAVTGNPASVSGNSQPHVYKYPRLSDMLGNGKSNAPSVEIDLRNWSDVNAGKLTPAQRDRMNRGSYGTGKQGITINLSPRKYRVDGRGATMRAALKLAKTIVGVGKRLPKNLYKELVLEILSQILGQLERRLDFAYPEKLMVLKNTTIMKTWAIDPRYAMFQGGDLVIPGGGQLSQSPVSTPYTPGLGEFAVASVSALPSGSTANVNAWTAAGFQPWITMRDEVMQNLISLANTSTLTVFRNIVMGRDLPGVFNSVHVATLRIAGRQNTAPVPTFKTVAINATNTWGNGQFTIGGNGPNTKTDFAHKQNDRKVGMTAAQQAILRIAFTGTEVGDFIDSIYDALPRHRRYGRSYLDKLARIFAHWDEINWAQAMQNVIVNHFEDELVGRFLGKAQKQLRKTSTSGITMQYGVTMGSGSTPYLEISF